MGENNRGFTLIELLVVIAIIGMIAVLGIGNFQTSLKRARDAQRKADLQQIRSALEMYRADNGVYPTTGGSWWGDCGDLGGSHGVTGPTAYVPNLAPTYIEKLPKDPRSGQNYYNGGSYYNCGSWRACYLYSSNGADYKLLAHCSPEAPGAYSTTDPFYDNRCSPVGSTNCWAWQVHSGPNSAGW